MTDVKWYPIGVHAPRERPLANVTTSLPPGDVPMAFAVDVEGPILRLQFMYPYVTSEPTVPMRAGGVDFAVGAHSRRLFALSLDLRELRAPAGRELQYEVHQKVRTSLRDAFALLRDGAAFGGPRANYRMAVEGLGIETPEASDRDVPPPAWMTDAVARMRDEHQGPRSGR